ncbi:MAG: hypothetical protein Q7T13_05270 [Polaromonas sp.]|nr:hypothetical protein [Polaromonas sp.]
MASSERLEDFGDRVAAADQRLAKLAGGEVRSSELVATLAALAKEWLRMSPELRNTAGGFLPVLDPYDIAMTELLQATKARTRATAYRRKLAPFVDAFLDKVVVAFMRFEGSPSQAAARAVESVFHGSVTDEELAYVQEAARCSSLHCHRAALIMLWAAGMARVHNGVQKAGFAAFNAAVVSASSKRTPPFSRVTKGLTINSLAELQRARDADVLIVGLELWAYDSQVFDEQERLLGTRNSAAHPGMFTPLSLDVRQFADKVRRYMFDVVK